jgi:hypothetical protein
MPISLPATITIRDQDIPAFRSALGLDPVSELPAARTVSSVDGHAAGVELPTSWRKVEERAGETYMWPQGEDVYDPFTVYEGTTSRGTIRLAIGWCRRAPVWGKDRLYLITFHVTAGGKRPLCEFLETDDYTNTGELVAIIRGTGESKRGMYGPEDVLPSPYRRLETGIYRDFIDVDRAWDKQAVVAHETDFETMLAHSLIQADLRFDIRPS